MIFGLARSGEAEVESFVFSVKSNLLNPLSFYSFASALHSSKIFKGLKINFQQSENSIWIYPNCSTYPSVLEYLRLSTAVLAKKYWTLAKLNIPIVSCKNVRMHMVFSYNLHVIFLLQP